MLTKRQEKLELWDIILSLFQHAISIPVYIAAIAAIIAFISAYLKEQVVSNIVLSLAVLGVAVYLIAKETRERIGTCVNPYLVIESDRWEIVVAPTYRKAHQRIIFSAKRKIKHYHFKVHWTGSDPHIEVKNTNNVGTLIHEIPKRDLVFRWKPWALRFFEPLTRRSTREVHLEFIVQDPGKVARPYHMISQDHVQMCKKLECHVSFAEFSPSKVYLIHYDARDVAEREEQLVSGINGYSFEIRPERGKKYAFQWGDFFA
jgi:hypothetical protein